MAPGCECHDLVGFEDVLPTLMDIVGQGPSEEDDLDGRTFWPQCQGKPGQPREWLFCYYDPRPRLTDEGAKHHRQAVRFAWDKRYKLYANGDLYDMKADPLEKTPIPEGQGGKSARSARKKLRAAIASMPEKPDFGRK